MAVIRHNYNLLQNVILTVIFMYAFVHSKFCWYCFRYLKPQKPCSATKPGITQHPTAEIATVSTNWHKWKMFEVVISNPFM